LSRSDAKLSAPLDKSDIEKMRKVCKLAARTLEHVAKFIKPGLTTDEIDKIVVDFTKSHGATNGPLGYHGFPKSICTSVNQVVCHGLPDDTILKEGDIINVDVTPVLEGFFGDSSATFCVGKVSPIAQELVLVAEQARDKGIEAITPNGFTGDIGFVTDKFVVRKGFSTVKEIGGHGIGRIFHTDPFVPAHGKKGRGEILRPWYCITVEPMINQGSAAVKEISIPHSSIKYYETSDKKLSAQFEHTVLITDTGYEVLTLP
jgi:methionyl aminopeptidase